MLSPFWTAILTGAGINALLAMGLYLSNSAGALSVAHAAIAGMGGYAGGVLTRNFEVPYPVSVVAGAALGVLVGCALALATARMNELVAGLTTLAFGEMMVVIAFNIEYIGGATSFYGLEPRTTLTVVVVTVAVTLYGLWRFDRSNLGLSARAVRDDRGAAGGTGVDANLVRLIVFAGGAGIAGAAGVLRAHYVLVVSPSDMGFFVSLNIVIYWVVGGSYTIWGPPLGAAILTVIPEALRFSPEARFILYGGILTLIVVTRPQGLIPRRTLPAWTTVRPKRPIFQLRNRS